MNHMIMHLNNLNSIPSEIILYKYNKTTYFMAESLDAGCCIFMNSLSFWGPMLRLKYFRISFKYSQAHTWKGGEGGGHKDNNFLA